MVLPRRQLSHYRPFFFAAVAAVLIAFAACDFQKNKDLGEVTAPIEAGKCSFKMVYDRIFGPRCTHCHGSDGGVSLQTYEEVVSHLDRIRARAIVQRDMPKPPMPALDANDIALLEEWIAEGAPLNPTGPEPSPSPSPSPGPGPGPGPDPSPTPSPEPSWEPIVSTFAGVKERIFGPKCSICHNPDGETDFDTEQDMITLGLIVPGDPTDSDLFRRVMAPVTDPDHMPPDGRLERDELTAIDAWILHITPAPSPSPSPTPSPSPSPSPQPSPSPAFPPLGRL